MTARQSKSPVEPPRIGLMPLPLNLKSLPVCVPSGILILTLPSKVGICISPHKEASIKLIGASQ